MARLAPNPVKNAQRVLPPAYLRNGKGGRSRVSAPLIHRYVGIDGYGEASHTGLTASV
jgi:hypothetical protein